jgi:hypothetical protein
MRQHLNSRGVKTFSLGNRTQNQFVFELDKTTEQVSEPWELRVGREKERENEMDMEGMMMRFAIVTLW